MGRKASAAPDGAAALPLPTAARSPIFLYLAVLIVLLAFGAPFGGLIDIPISFLLKNKLNLEAQEVAVFRALSAIPLYLAFVSGLGRATCSTVGLSSSGA